jgi:hypothetical protein
VRDAYRGRAEENNEQRRQNAEDQREEQLHGHLLRAF